MRKIKFIPFTIALLLFTAGAVAQPDSPDALRVASARFVEPLVEKWASEYERAHPGRTITVSSDSGDEGVDLHFIASRDEGESAIDGGSIIFTGRYALLPIANEGNPILNELNRKRLNERRLEEFFFETALAGGGAGAGEEPTYDVTVYSGSTPGSSANLFAAHFGYDAADLRGRRISGDDIFLINAVQKDDNGVAFNNLGYIFNLETRQLKEGLALVPLDLKRGQQEVLASADIDRTIALLEEESIPLIPVEHIGFVFREDNIAAKDFLHWVLTEGQAYNHLYGFLKTGDDLLSEQLKEIAEPRYTASF